MVDNLIFYLTKQIWIDLELYFESYEFSNIYEFRIFLEFFLIHLKLFSIFKKNKNVYICRELTW